MAIRDMVHIDEEKCNGCGECIPHCAEGALQIVNGKAKIIRDEFCDGLGACLGHCPQDAITVYKREAAEFDEELVKEHLAATQSGFEIEDCGGTCPSTHLMSLDRFGETLSPPMPAAQSSDARPSMLRQWPVQLHLVPADAPYLRNADLLVAADCAPVAYPKFHEDLLQGRAVVIGCPKLDNTEVYLTRLTALLQQSTPKSIAIAHMEVPCCFGLVRLVQQAARRAKLAVPTEEIVVNVDGTLTR